MSDGTELLWGKRRRLRIECEFVAAAELLMLPVFLCARLSSALREKRLVLIDQDGSDPGESNQMSAMVLYALLSIMLYMA
jgi:hypothetical protein